MKLYTTRTFHQALGQIVLFLFSIGKSLGDTEEGKTNLQLREICALKEHSSSAEVFKAPISSQTEI